MIILFNLFDTLKSNYYSVIKISFDKKSFVFTKKKHTMISFLKKEIKNKVNLPKKNLGENFLKIKV